MVVQLISPTTHAARAVTALKGRRELRNTPIYVLMPDGERSHPTMGGVEGLHLVPEGSAALDLPVMLLRNARESVPPRDGFNRLPTGKLDESLKRVLPRGPSLHKASRSHQSNGGSVSSDSDVDTTTKLATSSGERR